MIHFVTGATGLLGSHIAEQLVQQGEKIRALVRPASDTRFLKSLGVELCEGDLSNLSTLRRGIQGASVVYHTAAKVGDWGTWEEHRRDSIEGTRNILEACLAEKVGRLLYISSISAYGHVKNSGRPITEEDPLGSKFWVWDYYTKAKVEAERLVWEYHHRTGLPVTVIRPSWIYGPRDRTSIFRLAHSLEIGRVRILGSGENRLSTVYAGNVAEACLIAARRPEAIGQAYNVSNDGAITQKEFMGLFADALGVQQPKRHVPFPVAFLAAFLIEATYRMLHIRQPPFVTRYASWLIGRHTFYSTEKAQRELGWKPRLGYPEAIRKTVGWYKSLPSR